MHLDPHTAAKATSGPSAGLSAVPLFHAAWLFAAGIAATQIRWLQPGQILVAFVLMAAVCCVAALRAQRIAWLPIGLLWLSLGAWCAEMEPHPTPAQPLASLSDGLLRTVEGTVLDAGPLRTQLEQSVDEPSVAAPTQRIDLRVSNLEVVTDADGTQ